VAPPRDAGPELDAAVPPSDASLGDLGRDQGIDSPEAGRTASWTLVSAPAVPSGVTLNGVWAASANEVWVVGAQGTQGVAYFFDGMTWAASPLPAGTPALSGVWALGLSRAWAVGVDGTLLRHMATTGWALVPSGTTQALSGVWGTVGMDVWVVGQGKTALHWTGSALEPVTGGLDGDLLQVTGVHADELWAVGPGGSVYRGSFKGWMKQEHGLTQATLYAVSAPSSSDVWAMGAGIALHFDGTSWSAYGGAPSPAFGVYGAAKDDVWAVGPALGRGPVGHWDGLAWSAVPVPSTANLRSVHGTSATDLWAVGTLGTILHSGGR
jgi:hypothetical protein